MYLKPWSKMVIFILRYKIGGATGNRTPISRLQIWRITVIHDDPEIGATGPIRTGKEYKILSLAVVPASLIHGSAIQINISENLKMSMTYLEIVDYQLNKVVRVGGFEPPVSSSRSLRFPKLSYTLMVGDTGIEPVSIRCHRIVLPIYQSPIQ